MGGMDIADGIAIAKAQNKLILLSASDTSPTSSEKSKNVIRKIHPSDKQYLAPPSTSEGQKYRRAIARQRACAGSWQITEQVVLLLINCIIKIKTQNKTAFKIADTNKFTLEITTLLDFWEML